MRDATELVRPVPLLVTGALIDQCIECRGILGDEDGRYVKKRKRFFLGKLFD